LLRSQDPESSENFSQTFNNLRHHAIPVTEAVLKKYALTWKKPQFAKAEGSAPDYHGNPLHQKDLRDQSNRDWQSWDLARFAKLAKENPIHFLVKRKFFYYDEINKNFGIAPGVVPYLSPALAGHVRDILEYHRLDFFKKRYK
jgi:hypothetical protein